MRGIADQRRTADGVAPERIAAEQRPFVRLLDIADELVDVLVPAREVGRTFLARPFVGPGFDAPVAALDNADEIEQFTAPQEIVDHMAARPDPVDADVAREPRWQLRDRDQSAPGHAAGELRRISAE